MTSHFPWLLRLPDARLLSRTIQGPRIADGHHDRRRHGLVGHLFQNRFKSPVIGTDEYLLTCGRSIERNPVEAAMTPDPWSYPHSSARAHALGERDPLLSPNPWFDALHPDPDRRRQLGREFLSADDPREEAVRRDDWATGDAAFQCEMSRPAGRPALLHRGRPGTPAASSSPGARLLQCPDQ